MTILELSGFFVTIKRVCSRLFTAYRGNIVGRHRLFDSPRRPEALRCCKRAEKVAKIVGERMKLEPHGVGRERSARQPCPLDRALA